MEVKTIFITGAGQLGTGIAQVSIQSGFNTILRDIDESQVHEAAKAIESQLERLVVKEKIQSQDKTEALTRLVTTTDVSSAGDAEIVIEAVPESLDIKTKVLCELDSICPENTIFGSNTSAIPITKLAAVTQRPDRVIGTHFMNPVPVVRELEVIRGYLTSDDTFNTIITFAKAMGRDPITFSRDFAQFRGGEKTVRSATGMSNEMWKLANELMWQVVEGTTTIEEAAQEQMSTLGIPMSVFAFLDLIGLDTSLSIQEVIYEEYCQAYLYPHPLLRRLVEAGHLGIKTSVGFFDYSTKPPQVSSALVKFLSQ
ncbi:3-hydroxyacyl-CoA dehydrogenase NAD-binding domain-containing protein [Chloroflexota bacterium]